jgi:ABC-type dipeptide/oligopeptide/nickel transport system ATPase component
MNDKKIVNKIESSDDLPMDRAYCWLIVGKPGSGKTHCLKSLMYDYAKNKHFKFAVVWTQNKMTSDLDFLPEKAIRDDVTDDSIDAYITKLIKVKERTKKDLPPSAMIFEDCIGSKKLNMFGSAMSKLIILHRHLNISLFFLSQYLGGKTGSSTLLRECVNYAILFNTRFENSRQFLYKSCGGLFKKQEIFDEVLEKATAEKHRSLFYDASQNSIKTAYKHFKAPSKIPNFQMKF